MPYIHVTGTYRGLNLPKSKLFVEKVTRVNIR